MVKDSRRGGVPANEAMAQIARRLQEDPEYRAARDAEKARLAQIAKMRRLAERPVVDDLATVGVVTDSVWHLHQHPESFETAVPVLLKHLTVDHDDDTLSAVGFALQTRSLRPLWGEVVRLYLETIKDVVRDRLAAALSVCAVRIHYDDLLLFLNNDTLGSSRGYFIRPINRIGNRISPGAGRAAIAGFASDPVLGKETRAVLAGRAAND